MALKHVLGNLHISSSYDKPFNLSASDSNVTPPPPPPPPPSPTNNKTNSWTYGFGTKVLALINPASVLSYFLKSKTYESTRKLAKAANKKLIARPSMLLFDIMSGANNTSPLEEKTKTPPSAPYDLQITFPRNGKSVELAWQRPKDDGGHKDIVYVIQQQNVAKRPECACERPRWETIHEGTHTALEVLFPPVMFGFRVAAKNASGMSPFSDHICGSLVQKRELFQSQEISEPEAEIISNCCEKDDCSESDEETGETNDEDEDDIMKAYE